MGNMAVTARGAQSNSLVNRVMSSGANFTLGDPVARLTSASVELQRAQAAALAEQQAARVENLKLLVNDDPAQSPLLPAAIKTRVRVIESSKRSLSHLPSAPPN